MGGAPPPPSAGLEQTVAQLMAGVDEITSYIQQMQQDMGNLVSRVGEMEKALQEISIKSSMMEKALNSPSGYEGGAPPSPELPPTIPAGGVMG
jgi:uncharacterized coiled-coil protein SlyX